mgnify:CR=1 FL=1
MIELKQTFSTTVILEDIIIPNQWDITVTLIPDGKHSKLYNKAMERVQYYFEEVLDNSIFVGRNNVANLSTLNFKAQVHIFPDDPWDHLIAMCLYVKLNSMLEGVFHVENVVISSHQSRGISHSHDAEGGGTGHLLDLFDDEDESEIIKYWYNSDPELFLLHEGLQRITGDWQEADLSFDEPPRGDVVNIKDFKKKPPANDDDAT